MIEEIQIQAVTIENQAYWQINDDVYQLVLNYREGFKQEELAARYSNILQKYDFIVGDWSHDQLRLRGFYYDDCLGVPRDMKISTVEDYLVEYCSFGCSYFILERISGDPAVKEVPKQKNSYYKENKQKIGKKKWILKQRGK